jgi:hypothetical protein
VASYFVGNFKTVDFGRAAAPQAYHRPTIKTVIWRTHLRDQKSPGAGSDQESCHSRGDGPGRRVPDPRRPIVNGQPADGSADPEGTTQVGLALNTAAAAPHEASKFPREMGGASSSTGAFQSRVAPKAGTDGLSPA